jgi:hypothetical protein
MTNKFLFFFGKGQGAPWEGKGHKCAPWCQKKELKSKGENIVISDAMGTCILCHVAENAPVV